MSLVTIIWSMSASACLTLALIHILIWYRQRTRLVNLLFSSAALAIAAVAFCELSAMRAESPAAVAAALRMAHVPVWVIVVSLSGFVKLYFRAGRMWLLWTVVILRTMSLALNFLTGENLNYLHVTGLRHLQLFHETIAVPTGVPNPAMIVGQLSMLLLVLFVVDASRVAWQRGERQKAVVVGGTIVFFILVGTFWTALIFWKNDNLPLVFSPFYLGLCVAMSYELSIDVLEAARLARELRESEKRMMGAAQAATLGEISSALAHELNQPLAAILSNAQAAQRFLTAEPCDSSEIRDILRDIVADDERASEIIRRMRDLLARGVVHPQSVDANQLIQDVLTKLHGDLFARGVAVVADLESGLPPIYGDPVQYQQVLINLILNAADAMAENALDSRRLKLSSHRLHGQMVQICVTDNGHGIPIGHEEKIFEHRYTTRATGLGLGLSLSRKIAVAYGGNLWAEIQPGGGTVMCFSVPEAKDMTS